VATEPNARPRKTLDWDTPSRAPQHAGAHCCLTGRVTQNRRAHELAVRREALADKGFQSALGNPLTAAPAPGSDR
jgi:hypothetical protein